VRRELKEKMESFDTLTGARSSGGR